MLWAITFPDCAAPEPQPPLSLFPFLVFSLPPVSPVLGFQTTRLSRVEGREKYLWPQDGGALGKMYKSGERRRDKFTPALVMTLSTPLLGKVMCLDPESKKMLYHETPGSLHGEKRHQTTVEAAPCDQLRLSERLTFY